MFAADLRRVCGKLAANLICMVKVCCMLAAYTRQYCCRAFSLLQRVYNVDRNIQCVWSNCLQQYCCNVCCRPAANVCKKPIFSVRVLYIIYHTRKTGKHDEFDCLAMYYHFVNVIKIYYNHCPLRMTLDSIYIFFKSFSFAISALYGRSQFCFRLDSLFTQ